MFILTQKDPLDKWAEHKKQSVEMARRLARMRSISPSRATRMLCCGDTLRSRFCPECGKVHIEAAKRCRDRLCPLCSWRLSIQRYHEMIAVIDRLRPEIEAKGIHASMLTLTVRNVRVKDLKACLVSMQAAWKRLYQSKLWRDVWGWGRCLEITYNAEEKTVHPHLHILMLTRHEVDYDTADKEMRGGWRSAARLWYDPQTDIRKAYSTDGQSDIWHCAGEAFSYSVKPRTLVSMSDKLLEEFAAAIAGVRMTSYGGAIKEARAALGLQDEEVEEQHGSTTCECGTQLEEMVLAWSAGGYHRIQKEGVAV